MTSTVVDLNENVKARLAKGYSVNGQEVEDFSFGFHLFKSTHFSRMEQSLWSNVL